MTLEEFYQQRKSFFIDQDRGIVRFPDSRHSAMSTAEWFTDYNMQWVNVIRGYLWETENHENDYLMVYHNNFEIPTINIGLIIYLFHHFPKVKWIGLGCIKGKVGDIWEPQLKVFNNEL